MYLLKENVSEIPEATDNKKKYVHNKYEKQEEISISDIAENGFHFTDIENNVGISGTGLIPGIGANSKDKFGKEAIGKVFFARGIEGTMQIFNRVIILGYEIPINVYKADKDKSKYLLELQSKTYKDNETMSLLEAFEYTRRSMEEKNYFTFDIHDTEYDKKIDEEALPQQIKNINTHLDSIREIQINADFSKEEKAIFDRAYESAKTQREVREKSTDEIQAAYILINNLASEKSKLDKPRQTARGIDQCIENLLQGNDEEKKVAEKLTDIRKQITIAIRRESKKVVNNLIRGEIIPESYIGANAERIDYNEDRMEWIDTKRYPHNCHTMVLDVDNEVEGINLPKGIGIGKDKLRLLSIDGKTPAKSIDVIKEFYEHATQKEKFSLSTTNGNKDEQMIGYFLEYIGIYEQYHNDPEVFKEKLEKLQEEILMRYPDSKTIQTRKCSEETIQEMVNELCTKDLKKDRENEEGFER